MANKQLDGTQHDIDEEVMEHLINTQNRFRDSKNVKGIKRLNNLIHNRSLSFEQLKLIIHDFKNINPKPIIDEEKNEYEITGGDIFKNWVFSKYDEITGKVASTKAAGANATRSDMYRDENELVVPTAGRKDTLSNVVDYPNIIGNTELMEQINKIKELIKLI